ncbi:MAG: glutamine-hydrolyzing carbamoyl-phosphate synthase small subunit [Bacteroidetes bacterium]|nr:glutamine-hydrolyzing carbamoyl-phosphate synthase small subunit [Bacteroidota bacterium]
MNPTAPAARLVLENGTEVRGTSFGARTDRFGELVFNTSMTGYQEILSDPSYCRQTIIFTYPHIGNYGVNEEDMESRLLHVTGMVCREVSKTVSNWRATHSLPDFLKKHNIPGIEGVDTRFLTLAIRNEGAMRCLITHDMDTPVAELVQKIKESPDMVGADLASEVTTRESYVYKPDHQLSGYDQNGQPDTRFRVVAIDYGIKQNILRILNQTGCEVTVLPSSASLEEIRSYQPQGVFLSNGPGDPAAVTYTIPVVKELIESGIPVFGICLGHQIAALALGAKTYKLKFGHRGGNHPVKNLKTGAIEITAQNHGFAVDTDSLPSGVELTHLNLNDQTVEGIRHRTLPFFSVQYHPEASPGPHDSHYLFRDFISLMKDRMVPA